VNPNARNSTIFHAFVTEWLFDDKKLLMQTFRWMKPLFSDASSAYPRVFTRF
jgi:hypothetical protein